MGGKRIWVGLLTGKARATLSPRPPRFLTPELTVLSEPGLKSLPAGARDRGQPQPPAAGGPRSHLGPWGATRQDLPHPYPLTSH